MNDAALRSKIRNFSMKTGVPSQLLMQNYFLERLLIRISKSSFSDIIILKGGLLIASIIGIERRSTMDLDAAIKNIKVDENTIAGMVHEIIKINCKDDIDFEFVDIKEIRQADEYCGFRVRIRARVGRINQKVSIDISTGDIITPDKIRYSYKSLLDNHIIEIQTYNMETILAEKIETVISRGVLNTRMRDYYDIYILWTLKNYNILRIDLIQAINNTFFNRDSIDLLQLRSEIMIQVEGSLVLKQLWKKYIEKNVYARDVNFNDTVLCVSEILSLIE